MKGDFSKYSDEEAKRIADLIFGFLQERLTKKEHDELDEWVAASDENLEIFERLTDESNLEKAMQYLASVQTEHDLQKKKEEIPFERPREPLRFWQYAVAASVIIAAGIL